MRPGVVSLFLQVGRSSGFRLLREVQAGEPHISGQDVKFVFWSSMLFIVLYFEACFKPVCILFSAAFELCIRNVTLACQTLL